MASKLYKHHFVAINPPSSFKWLWKSKCIPKIKFFAWLMLKNKLNTRNMLRRRRKFLDEGYACPVCLQDFEETRDHLFFSCQSACDRWNVISIAWNICLPIHQRLKVARRIFAYPFFMEIFMIGTWCIWQERNALVFYGIPPNLHRWKTLFKKEVLNHLPRINSGMHASIQHWLNLL